jgi:tellurite resistance protein TerC
MLLSENVWPWIVFSLIVLALLALDLGVFHRRMHAISVREALIWSCVWITVALLFNVGIYFTRGLGPAIQFLTGYVIEKSLSIDNIFIFVLIFSYFAVPAQYQHRILFWGILGALLMRGILISVGLALLEKFHVVIYLLGAFLIITGIRMGFSRSEEVRPERNPVLRLVRRILPVTTEDAHGRFFVRRAGRLFATTLFVVLVVVESTDLIFAVDSIPAIFAVTRDPFIVYTSNVFAILGLRSLYFVFASMIQKFYYLKIGLAIILIYVGIKMLVADYYEISPYFSLLVIVFVLGLTALASFIRAKRVVRGRLNQ